MTLRPIRPRLLPFCLIVLTVLGTVNSLAGQESVFDDPIVTGESDATATDPLAEEGDLATPEVDPREEYMRRMAEAEALMEQKKWAEAAQMYNEILSVGRHPRALLNQGICFRELGATELAISSLSMATIAPGAAMEPGLVEQAHLMRGELYAESGRYREAIDDFTQATTLNPASAEPHYQQGRAMLRLVVTTPGAGMDQSAQGTLLQAVRSLERAIKLRSDFGEAYLERGRVLFRLRQLDHAITDFQEAVQRLGRSSNAAADLGVAYALRATQETYRPNPDEARITQDLRAALTSFNDNLADARLGERILPWEIRDPLELEGRPERVMLSRAETHIALGHEQSGSQQEESYRAALADADELLRHDIDDQDKGRALYIRGSALRLLGDLNSAIAAFTNAIRVLEGAGISYGDAYLRRGICYYHQDKLDVALQDFQAASTVQNNPYIYEPRAMMWAGVVEARRGEYDDAIRSYSRSIAAAPRFTAAYLNRGLAYMNLGRYDQALDDFNTILRQHPNHNEARRYRELASRQR